VDDTLGCCGIDALNGKASLLCDIGAAFFGAAFFGFPFPPFGPATVLPIPPPEELPKMFMRPPTAVAATTAFAAAAAAKNQPRRRLDQRAGPPRRCVITGGKTLELPTKSATKRVRGRP
jgi:hypothetical protein